MHDFLLAKEIIETLKKIALNKGIIKVKSVDIEIGMITHTDHTEDINLENLEFGLKNIAKNTALEKAEFRIKKVSGNNWRINKISA
ncbi:MAG: hydrogenase/urease maturation nickel metallochaperone HypA [Candidatus Moranbacteria bacterium]|nr:hydrogenase/urease maturation nickel metallochaperone HypA [Candidatus Moranbacteria bacterium]